MLTQLQTLLAKTGGSIGVMASSVAVSYAPGWEESGGFPAGGSLAEIQAIIGAAEWVVRERWFFSDVSLIISESAISYSRVPVVDFAMAFNNALEVVAADGSSKFRIVGGPVISMERHGDDVEIGGGQGWSAVAGFVDLTAACVIFRRRFIDEVTEKFPDLLMNDLIDRLFRTSGLREMSRDRFLRYQEITKRKNEIASGRMQR